MMKNLYIKGNMTDCKTCIKLAVDALKRVQHLIETGKYYAKVNKLTEGKFEVCEKCGTSIIAQIIFELPETKRKGNAYLTPNA